MGLGEMGLGEMGQNPSVRYLTVSVSHWLAYSHLMHIVIYD